MLHKRMLQLRKQLSNAHRATWQEAHHPTKQRLLPTRSECASERHLYRPENARLARIYDSPFWKCDALLWCIYLSRHKALLVRLHRKSDRKSVWLRNVVHRMGSKMWACTHTSHWGRVVPKCINVGGSGAAGSSRLVIILAPKRYV